MIPDRRRGCPDDTEILDEARRITLLQVLGIVSLSTGSLIALAAVHFLNHRGVRDRLRGRRDE